MKYPPTVAAVMVLASLLGSCTLPWASIKPGTKIGEMEVLDFCEGPNISEICTWDELEVGDCILPAGLDSFWISIGWVEDTQAQLEESWLGSRWSMTLDGRKVDLASFGTYDMDFEGKRARVWDVCLSNPTPGEHAVQYDFFLEHSVRRGNHTTEMKFTVQPPVPESSQ